MDELAIAGAVEQVASPSAELQQAAEKTAEAVRQPGREFARRRYFIDHVAQLLRQQPEFEDGRYFMIHSVQARVAFRLMTPRTFSSMR